MTIIEIPITVLEGEESRKVIAVVDNTKGTVEHREPEKDDGGHN